MSSSDTAFLVLALLRDVGDMITVPDRSHQGVLNHLLVTKLMMTGFVNDSNVIFNGKSVIDPTRVYWWGISQVRGYESERAARKRTVRDPTARNGTGSTGALPSTPAHGTR